MVDPGVNNDYLQGEIADREDIIADSQEHDISVLIKVIVQIDSM